MNQDYHLANALLKVDSFIGWWNTYKKYEYEYDEREIINFAQFAEEEIESEGIGEFLNYLHWLRMDLSQGFEEIIKDLEKEEEYELCGKLKQKVSQLRAEALGIEMKLEKRL